MPAISNNVVKPNNKMERMSGKIQTVDSVRMSKLSNLEKAGKNEIKKITEDPFGNLGALNNRWRILCWKDIIEESLQKPALGWGFGRKFIPPSIAKLGWGGSWRSINYGGNQMGFQDPHNSYLSVLHRTGLIGLGVFIFLMLYFVYKTIRFIMSSADNTNAFMVIASLLIFIFINILSLFMVVLEGPFLGIFCWLAMGFVEAIMNIEKKTSC
jgi:O-antigen ligase